MPRLSLRAAALAALAAGAPAQAAPSLLGVERAGPVTFSVAPRGGETAAPYFWCVAGEYADRRLGAAPTARIWRLSEPPRRPGQPILFSLDPTGRASRTGLVLLGPDDGSLSVAMAQTLCDLRRMSDIGG